MTEFCTCPADGCDYSGPTNSVCAHYSGKRDSTHRGGYERARMLVEEQGDETKPASTASTESSSTSSEQATATDGGAASFEVLDPPEPEPSSTDRRESVGQVDRRASETEDQDSRSEGTSTEGCPWCGVEFSTEALDDGDTLRCTECSGVFVWNE